MKKRSVGRRIALWGASALGVVLAIAMGFVGYLTITEYRPDAVEPVQVAHAGVQTPGESITLMTYNIGYGGLGAQADFFMDGGSGVQPSSKAEVEGNLEGVAQILRENPVDVLFLQEVDLDSKRSYGIDEQAFLQQSTQMSTAFAYNYNCNYVPYPLPTIGRVKGGIVTMTHFAVSEAMRVSLPVPFAWPVRMCNLKRCLLVERVALANGKQLVLVNLHLEAYDDGEGKKQQTQQLMAFLTAEYATGNYVIAGGDFNQTFPQNPYPVIDDENWAPGVLEADMLPEGWQFAVDTDAPTCRLLNKPFSGSYDDTQLYILDGFIVSPNVQVDDVSTLDTRFRYTDHNPVKLTVTLR